MMTQTQAISSNSGTPLYLAPEVAAGQSATIRSDVYALGVTLYQFLVGDFSRPLAPGWEQDIDDALLRQDIADAANGDPARRLDSATALAERIRSLATRHESMRWSWRPGARAAGDLWQKCVRAGRGYCRVIVLVSLGTTAGS